MKRVSTSTALALLAAMATGCGGASPATRRTASKDKTSEVRTPVKAGAVKEFEAGLRAQRLGGADSNAKAKAKFEAALAIDGTLWEAWHNIGYLAVDGGDDAAAVVAFGKALAINGDNTSSRLARAEAERRLGKVGDARADYQAVLANADDDDTLRRDAAARMASLLRDAGKFEEAIEGLRDVIRTSGASARIYTELGMIYIEQKRFELAALVLAKAVELDAKEPAAYNALALLALRQGKAQEAFDRFDYAASLDPKYTDARFNKATVLLDAGDYARAKVELDKILEKRPDDFGAVVALGIAERGLKDFAAAKAAWENVVKRASARSETRADAMFNLALLKIDFLQDTVGGKADLERYINEAPSGHSKRAAAEEKRKELK
ncbi:MAG TPA: tetratricopeptide repeat protein [Kofleriaceae bacterium]|nr:tetratricopeptide repeat protein [Kofleriaceae bacterium]